MAVKLIIAGSRTVDPTDEVITAEVLKLIREISEIPGSHESHEIPGRDLTEGQTEISQRFPLSVQEVTAMLKSEISHVVCGESPGGGADASGKRWARSFGIEVISEPITAEDVRRWGKYVAPKVRNRRVAEQGDLALVFWDGQSNGATDLVTRMVLRGKRVEVVPSKPVRKRRARPAQAVVAEQSGMRFVRADGSELPDSHPNAPG